MHGYPDYVHHRNDYEDAGGHTQTETQISHTNIIIKRPPNFIKNPDQRGINCR